MDLILMVAAVGDLYNFVDILICYIFRISLRCPVFAVLPVTGPGE